MEFKFRQPVYEAGKFHHWHYWGFVNGRYQHPVNNHESDMWTMLLDSGRKEIFSGDIIEFVIGTRTNSPKTIRAAIEYPCPDNENGKMQAAFCYNAKIHDVKDYYLVAMGDIEDSEMEYKVIGNVTQNKDLPNSKPTAQGCDATDLQSGSEILKQNH